MVSSLIFQILLYKAFLKNDLKIPKQFTNDQMYGSLEVEAWMGRAERYVRSALFYPTSVHSSVSM